MRMESISVNDHNHALKVWGLFEIKTFGDYHDLYVQADTAQLSDVFENFRSLFLEILPIFLILQLDRAYFVSLSSLAHEAMLKETKAKIELFIDINMVLMTEKGIRGGLTQVVKKHAVANNKYLPNCDSTKKVTHLQYLDANNLYGYAMNKKLPLDSYEWDNVEKFDRDFIKNYDDNGDKGYLLEVDVEHPSELRSAHEDFSFLPERRSKLNKEFEHKVTKEIEKAHKRVHKTFNITREPDNKLIATVQDKSKYVVNISTLKQASNQGCKLQKVHRVIKYN